jgi:hypothetical protein
MDGTISLVPCISSWRGDYFSTRVDLRSLHVNFRDGLEANDRGDKSTAAMLTATEASNCIIRSDAFLRDSLNIRRVYRRFKYIFLSHGLITFIFV